MRASADRALALNSVYCGRLDEMDLPLLKNDITTIVRIQKPVIYSRYTR